MSKPLISYVITAYNSEKFIADAMECAFKQTYSPLEIVVSDDCSKDGTWDIVTRCAAEYKGEHKIVLNRNEQNMGISQHMSKAYIDIASGDIIVAAHADDISMPDRVERTYNFLISHPDCNAVSFAMNTTDADGNVFETCRDFEKCTERYYGFVDGLHMGNIPAPSRAFYKNVMTTFGWLREDCPTEDELITFRAQLMGKKNAYLKDQMVFYRKHEGSASNHANFDRFPLSKIYEQLESDANKAVELGLITKEKTDEILAEIAKGHKYRQCYRDYLVKPTIWTLIKIMFRGIPLKNKLYLVKIHFTSKK